MEFHQGLIGTCTNGRLSDFKIAAEILNGKKINPNVRLLILPSSKKVYLDALKLGFIEIFVAMIFPSTLRDLIAYSIVLLILVFRPHGFFGEAYSARLRL